MQARGIVPLHAEEIAARWSAIVWLRFGLGGFIERSLAVVFFERHPAQADFIVRSEPQYTRMSDADAPCQCRCVCAGGAFYRPADRADCLVRIAAGDVLLQVKLLLPKVASHAKRGWSGVCPGFTLW